MNHPGLISPSSAIDRLAAELGFDAQQLTAAILDGTITLVVAGDEVGAALDDGTCAACKAPIKWAKTAAGRPVPLNPRVLTVIGIDGQYHRGRESHFATCPAARDFRR